MCAVAALAGCEDSAATAQWCKRYETVNYETVNEPFMIVACGSQTNL